jgi:hypothetical protein
VNFFVDREKAPGRSKFFGIDRFQQYPMIGSAIQTGQKTFTLEIGSSECVGLETRTYLAKG